MFARMFYEFRHALGYLEGKKVKKKEKKLLPTETPGHRWLLSRPVVRGDTVLPPTPVLGPEQNNGLCHPLPLFMPASSILNMWHSCSYRMRHSWLTQFGAISLNQAVAGSFPPPLLLRYVPGIFIEREGFSPLFPRRLASSSAYSR